MKSATNFTFARMPELHFGAGKLAQLPRLLAQHSPQPPRVLLVTGSASLLNSAHYQKLSAALNAAGIWFAQAGVSGEPSPEFVDEISARYRAERLTWVVGIGGGSAMDAGKAISAMLPQQGSVTAYLEGIASAQHDGRKTPYIAVPTSSGTGSEATKNAVLSQIGAQGVKSSLRHDNFVPDLALVDPELILSCPPAVTAACSLDALTQLLEAYVSTQASPLSDALAWSGLEHAKAGLIPAFTHGATDLAARSHMAYAAFLSGVALANAGLGVVHGLAGPIGAYHTIPHGVVCGTLLAEATRLTIETLFATPDQNPVALEKYAKVGVLLSGQASRSLRDDCALLVETLQNWSEQTGIPRLSHYAISRTDFAKIVKKSNSKNGPVALSTAQMTALLEARL